MTLRSPALFAVLAPAAAHAAEPAAAAPLGAGSVVQVILGLAVVLAAMAGAAWLMKRLNAGRATGGALLRVVGGTSLGGRERVVVLELAEQWIVVGVAPGRVNTLATLPRQEGSTAPASTAQSGNFAGWLKKSVENRRGR